jgi:hypothetical protein
MCSLIRDLNLYLALYCPLPTAYCLLPTSLATLIQLTAYRLLPTAV